MSEKEKQNEKMGMDLSQEIMDGTVDWSKVIPEDLIVLGIREGFSDHEEIQWFDVFSALSGCGLPWHEGGAEKQLKHWEIILYKLLSKRRAQIGKYRTMRENLEAANSKNAVIVLRPKQDLDAMEYEEYLFPNMYCALNFASDFRKPWKKREEVLEENNGCRNMQA